MREYKKSDYLSRFSLYVSMSKESLEGDAKISKEIQLPNIKNNLWQEITYKEINILAK